MIFEWDRDKAANNFAKHQVSFDEAKTVFEDPLYLDFYDPDHSKSEERYLIVGLSEQDRVLIVSYTERKSAIRIISARKVTKAEKRFYEEE